MSRQFPELEDIEYLIEWAERKIIQMAKEDRASNFVNVAELARAIAFYLNTMEMVCPDGHPNSPTYGHLKLPHLN